MTKTKMKMRPRGRRCKHHIVLYIAWKWSNRDQETGEEETGNREQGTGNGQRGKENREMGNGNWTFEHIANYRWKMRK